MIPLIALPLVAALGPHFGPVWPPSTAEPCASEASGQLPWLEQAAGVLQEVAEASTRPEIRGRTEHTMVRAPARLRRAAPVLAVKPAPTRSGRVLTIEVGDRLPPYFRSLPPPR